MSFVIRIPSPSDAPALADLHVATWKEAYAHLLPEDYFSEEYVAGRHRMWKHVLTESRPDMRVRVAVAEGSIIGFAWAGPGIGIDVDEPPKDRQLYAIYVLSTHYGSGAGQALLDAALEDAPAMLWVAKANPRATAFYRRNGFTFDGTEQTDPHAPLITDARMTR